MLVVSYTLGTNNTVDVLLPELRRFKNVRLGPTTYALVGLEDEGFLKRSLGHKLQPGDQVWIVAANGPGIELNG